MTREEAIMVLEEEAEYLYQDDRPYNREAFDMAIEALEENHCEECLFFGLFHRCKECGRVNVIYDDKFEWGGTE